MGTELLYLHDTYLFSSDASILMVQGGEKGTDIILDRTIFYPQGGGQPADIGKITSDHGEFTVTDVRLDENGTVHHYGGFEQGSFKQSEKVTLAIDRDRRLLHARIHSAGHLIDVAVGNLGIQGLKPTKGYHFSDGPYVQYDGELADAGSWREQVERAVNELVFRDLAVDRRDLSPEQALAEGIKAPPGKSARIVNFRGYAGHGCGGTHVGHTAEIRRVVIRSVSSKKGVTRIAYALE